MGGIIGIYQGGVIFGRDRITVCRRERRHGGELCGEFAGVLVIGQIVDNLSFERVRSDDGNLGPGTADLGDVETRHRVAGAGSGTAETDVTEGHIVVESYCLDIGAPFPYCDGVSAVISEGSEVLPVGTVLEVRCAESAVVPGVKFEACYQVLLLEVDDNGLRLIGSERRIACAVAVNAIAREPGGVVVDIGRPLGTDRIARRSSNHVTQG